MLGWIKYQIELQSAQRFRDKLEREHRRELRHLYETKTASDDIQEFIQVHWMDAEMAHDDVQTVISQRLFNLADKHFISLPPHSDTESWEQTKMNGRVLSRSAIRSVRAEIRKEQHEDRAAMVQWAAVATGLLGATTGLVAVVLNSAS